MQISKDAKVACVFASKNVLTKQNIDSTAVFLQSK